MTHPLHPISIREAVQVLPTTALTASQAMELLLKECMKIERQHALGVGPFQRGEARWGQANGFKPKQLKTRVEPLNLQVPQFRGASFYPKALERGSRSRPASGCPGLATGTNRDVCPRRLDAQVSQVTEELCGCEISSSDVSRAMAQLDEEFGKWRPRPLDSVKYLILDARYEKVREAGCVRDCALLTAIGIDEEGRRSVLGVSVSLSEAEVHWREFMKSLLARDLHGWS